MSFDVTSSEILEEFSIEKFFIVINLFIFDTPNHRFGTQIDINWIIDFV